MAVRVSPRVGQDDVARSLDTAMQFVARAANELDPTEAAGWALAAKNMAACVHSLAGARVTQAKGGA